MLCWWWRQRLWKVFWQRRYLLQKKNIQNKQLFIVKYITSVGIKQNRFLIKPTQPRSYLLCSYNLCALSYTKSLYQQAHTSENSPQPRSKHRVGGVHLFTDPLGELQGYKVSSCAEENKGWRWTAIEPDIHSRTVITETGYEYTSLTWTTSSTQRHSTNCLGFSCCLQQTTTTMVNDWNISTIMWNIQQHITGISSWL